MRDRIVLLEIERLCPKFRIDAKQMVRHLKSNRTTQSCEYDRIAIVIE